MKVVRKLLTPDEITPPTLRYDATCSCVQFSPDGGVTWVDDPSDDPRSAPKFLKPPLIGSDIACRAANNMTAYIEQTLEGIFTATSVIQIGGALLGAGILILTDGAGIIVEVFLAVAEAVSALTLTAVEAAFTPTVYDQITCILYCDLNSSGQLTAGKLDDVQAQVDALGNSIVSDVFAGFVAMWGVNGFNNAGVLGDAPHDCSGCACLFSYCFDFSTSDYASYGVSALSPYGSYASGQGWRSVSGNGLILDIEIPGGSVELREVQWGGTSFGVTGSSGRATFYRLSGTNVYEDNQSGLGNPYTIDTSHTADADELYLNPYGGATADIYITSLKVTSSAEIAGWSDLLC